MHGKDPGQDELRYNDCGAALTRREGTVLYASDERGRWRGQDRCRQSFAIHASPQNAGSIYWMDE